MKICAYCGVKIGETYYTYTDNFLQVKYFDELDGSNNIFCDVVCAGNALMLEAVENEDFGKEIEEEE